MILLKLKYYHPYHSLVKNTKDTDITVDEEFDQIKRLVSEANELSNEEDYKAAKHKLLDAAEISLEKSKTSIGSDKLSYQTITKSLVDEAKEMQLLIEAQLHPLPSTPSGYKSKSPDSVIKNKNKSPDDGLIFVEKPSPNLLQLMVIQDTGTPIFTWRDESLQKSTAEGINEILFSGAITAVNQLLQEILSKPIQNINFEEGNLVMRFNKELIFVAYTLSDVEIIEKPMKKFSKQFMESIFKELKSEITKGLLLDSNEDVVSLVQSCFNVN